MKMRIPLAVLMISLVTCVSAKAWEITSIIHDIVDDSPSARNLDAFLLKEKAFLRKEKAFLLKGKTFLLKEKAVEDLVNKSADQLFALVATKKEQAKAQEQQKKINATTDAKEKDAMTRKATSSKLAAISKAAADERLKADVKQWDAKKKKLAVASLYNLALGLMKAVDLSSEEQSLRSEWQSLLSEWQSLLSEGRSLLSSNPKILANPARVNSLKEACDSLKEAYNPLKETFNSLEEAWKSLCGIISGAGKVIEALPPVFRAANIDVELPSSSAETPKDIDL